jgi:membrane fusion protein, multidrug efflux system
MKATTLLVGLLVAATAAVAGLNHTGTPVPGLEWVRLDALTAKLATGPDTAEKTDKGSKKGGGGRRGGYDGPVPVVVASATAADVPIYLRGVGSARALNTVTVKPQVDGRILKIHFREGQDVKRGDLLAEIDPITYQANLDQAVAKKALTQAQLANAELDMDRYTKVAPGVVTQKTVDTQRAQVGQLSAQLKADAAAIANVQAILNYTRIVAPIDGRTGQRLVDEGNLIRAGDAGIVTIAEIRPISVTFTLPQQQLKDVKAALAAGAVPVEAIDADDKTVLDTGTLQFIDNQIDQATGTIRMKADLPNEQLQLWPGQFTNVRVKVDTLKGVTTTPVAAIQRGPLGAFVYVMKPAEGDGAKATVAVRPVVIAQQDDKLAVITTGLAVGEQVVTSGFARLKDGAEVGVTKPQSAPGQQTPSDNGPAASVPSGTGAAPTAEAAPVAPADKPKGERRQRAEGEGGKGNRQGGKGKSRESAVQ